MKLLTLNAHSRPDTDAQTIPHIASLVLQAGVDVIALQEVNQSRTAAVVSEKELREAGAMLPPASPPPVGADNFALQLARTLRDGGGDYHWCYLPFKLGYRLYDEGLALFWRGEARGMHALPLSLTQEYADWRRRMALGVQVGEHWFYSVHTSRWEDDRESFALQWRRLHEGVSAKASVFLMGDFNCPADRVGQGYDRMIGDGWRDTFTAAESSAGYATAQGSIDGWQDETTAIWNRIDYIMTNRADIRVLEARTVFDPSRGEEAVSDHCGLLCHWEEGRDEKRIK